MCVYVLSNCYLLQLSDLEKHAHRVQEFGEAERFMFDVSSKTATIILLVFLFNHDLAC